MLGAGFVYPSARAREGGGSRVQPPLGCSSSRMVGHGVSFRQRPPLLREWAHLPVSTSQTDRPTDRVLPLRGALFLRQEVSGTASLMQLAIGRHRPSCPRVCKVQINRRR